MRLLLDTHALSWWLFGSRRLPHRVSQLIAGDAEKVFVSAVSAFELATKYRIGKWPEARPLVEGFDALVGAQDFEILPITVRHSLRAGLLAGDHRDPFDRLLAAQASLEGLDLVSVDHVFGNLGIVPLWE
ncbi:type II toxin-antitoxin system VapC family toxin [Consotaella aegiceratis]|uniref:type II toxin-antitoxin system VapC family toxin n=1 Tax=Consotaella aegiceratis TaxID=3097961 RepID=UPI002F416408